MVSIAFGFQLFQKGLEAVQRATEEDKKRNYHTALKLYEEGTQYFIHAIKCKEICLKVHVYSRTPILYFKTKIKTARQKYNLFSRDERLTSHLHAIVDQGQKSRSLDESIIVLVPGV